MPGGQVNIRKWKEQVTFNCLVFFLLGEGGWGVGVVVVGKKRQPPASCFSLCDFKEEMRNLAEDLLPPETRPAISNSYRPFVAEGAPVQDQTECVENGNLCL